MRILINGESEQLEGNKLSVLNLLEFKNVESPDMVAVQLNGEFIEKNSYATTFIAEDDSLEFLYFMGGGTVS